MRSYSQLNKVAVLPAERKEGNCSHQQGRINQYANYAMAWGPPVQGAPLGGTNFLIFKFQ